MNVLGGRKCWGMRLRPLKTKILDLSRLGILVKCMVFDEQSSRGHWPDRSSLKYAQYFCSQIHLLLALIHLLLYYL